MPGEPIECARAIDELRDRCSVPASLPSHEFCRVIVLVCYCFGFIIVAAFSRNIRTRTARLPPSGAKRLRGLAGSALLDNQLVLSMQHTILTGLYRKKFVNS